MIIVEPWGGLCNRVRVMKSAINLAKKIGQPVKVYWSVDSDLNSEFEQLFESCDLVELTNIHSSYDPRMIIGKKFSKMYISQTVLDQFNVGNPDKMENEKFEKYILTFLENPKNTVYIKTWNDFYRIGELGYAWLKPVPHLMKQIEDIGAKVGKDGIGIHIRRTDNAEAISNSPTSLFIEKMEAEIAKNPDVRFYLATDDEGEKKKLTEHFGDKVVVNPQCHLSRNSNQGMESAVIDLFCLANTSKIYGSFNSSFSDEAAKIHGIEKIIVRK